MIEQPRDRWIGIALSVLLHGAIVGVLAIGVWKWRQRSEPAVPALAIEATVVNARDVPALRRLPRPEAAPPSPEEVAKQRELREREARAQAEREVRERAADERRVTEERRQAEAKAAEQKRRETERADAERKAAAERRAAEERRLADERRAAEEKRREEAKRQAEAKRLAEEQRGQREREADLQRSLAVEDRLRQAQASGLQASWIQQIQARIQRAWIRPPSARTGLECIVNVQQVPGGEVVSAKVAACNGDAAVRESIEAAVLRASPLPPPPDPAMFERNLEIVFKPRD